MCQSVGPSQHPGSQLDGTVRMDASPAFMQGHNNEPDPDAWFQHNEPPTLGIADIFDNDQDLVM